GEHGTGTGVGWGTLEPALQDGDRLLPPAAPDVLGGDFDGSVVHAAGRWYEIGGKEKARGRGPRALAVAGCLWPGVSRAQLGGAPAAATGLPLSPLPSLLPLAAGLAAAGAGGGAGSSSNLKNRCSSPFLPSGPTSSSFLVTRILHGGLKSPW